MLLPHFTDEGPKKTLGNFSNVIQIGKCSLQTPRLGAPGQGSLWCSHWLFALSFIHPPLIPSFAHYIFFLNSYSSPPSGSLASCCPRKPGRPGWHFSFLQNCRESTSPGPPSRVDTVTSSRSQSTAHATLLPGMQPWPRIAPPLHNESKILVENV